MNFQLSTFLPKAKGFVSSVSSFQLCCFSTLSISRLIIDWARSEERANFKIRKGGSALVPPPSSICPPFPSIIHPLWCMPLGSGNHPRFCNSSTFGVLPWMAIFPSLPLPSPLLLRLVLGTFDFYIYYLLPPTIDLRTFPWRNMVIHQRRTHD